MTASLTSFEVLQENVLNSSTITSLMYCLYALVSVRREQIAVNVTSWMTSDSVRSCAYIYASRNMQISISNMRTRTKQRPTTKHVFTQIYASKMSQQQRYRLDPRCWCNQWRCSAGSAVRSVCDVKLYPQLHTTHQSLLFISAMIIRFVCNPLTTWHFGRTQ